VLLLLGGILVILGVCFHVPWVLIAGVIVAVLGLLLFLLWVLFCAAFTSCPLMQTVHCFLFWIVAVVAPIVTIVALIFGGLVCGIAAALTWGGWGSIYAWLGYVMRRVGCPTTC